jgi:hypothetical protein
MTQALTNFSKIGFTDSELSRLESNIENAFAPIFTKEILNGRLINDVALITGITNKVEHGLQRDVLGYIVVKRGANAVVWDGEAINTMRSSFLNLLCSANVTVSLWVF